MVSSKDVYLLLHSSASFSAMLSEAFRDADDDITIQYRMDGKLLNLRRLQAKSKVKEATVRDLLFADDCALNASSEPDMQQSMNKFSSACDSFGLTISTKKTEVVFQPAPRNAYNEPSITVKGETELWNLLHTLAEYSSDLFALTMKLMPELQRPVLHLVDSGRRFGKGMV